MYCYYITNIKTNEEEMIFGYDLNDAYRRSPSLNRSEWEVTMSEYED